MRKFTLLVGVFCCSSSFAFTPLETLHIMQKDASQFCTTIESESKPWVNVGDSSKGAIPSASLSRAEELLDVCNTLAPAFSDDIKEKADAAFKQDAVGGLATMMAFSRSQCASPCLKLATVIAQTLNKSSSKETGKLLANIRKPKFPSYYALFSELKLIRLGLDRHLWSADNQSLAALKKIETASRSAYDSRVKGASTSEKPEDETSSEPSSEFMKSAIADFHDAKKYLDDLQVIALKLK